jgi:uncharacterized protein involved in exopolysaccharide biosynthesis
LSEGAVSGVRATSPRHRIVRRGGFRFARRPLWLVLPLVLAALGALGALLFTQIQRPSYRASADVLISGGTVLPFLINPPRHAGVNGQAEARLARSPELAVRVAARAGVPGMTATKLLGASHVTPAANADLLRFSVSDSHGRDAIALVNAYASEFAIFKAERDRVPLENILRSIDVRIRSLRAKGATNSDAYFKLLHEQGQLETLRRIVLGQTTVLQPAVDASQYPTHKVRNGILGGALGALLGIVILAFRRSRAA